MWYDTVFVGMEEHLVCSSHLTGNSFFGIPPPKNPILCKHLSELELGADIHLVAERCLHDIIWRRLAKGDSGVKTLKEPHCKREAHLRFPRL